MSPRINTAETYRSKVNAVQPILPISSASPSKSLSRKRTTQPKAIRVLKGQSMSILSNKYQAIRAARQQKIIK